jgi:hypothetical protein
VADAMCREAYKTAVPRLLIGMVPHALWDKVAEDRRGVVHERVRA